MSRLIWGLSTHKSRTRKVLNRWNRSAVPGVVRGRGCWPPLLHSKEYKCNIPLVVIVVKSCDHIKWRLHDFAESSGDVHIVCAMTSGSPYDRETKLPSRPVP